MTWLDWLWETIDNSLFYLAAVALLLCLAAVAACPVLLWRIDARLADLRPCECRHRDDDGPGPVLPRVLPRVRRIGEEAPE